MSSAPVEINEDYWHEKMPAGSYPARIFSEDLFKAYVHQSLNEAVDGEDITSKQRKEILADISDDHGFSWDTSSDAVTFLGGYTCHTEEGLFDWCNDADPDYWEMDFTTYSGPFRFMLTAIVVIIKRYAQHIAARHGVSFEEYRASKLVTRRT